MFAITRTEHADCIACDAQAAKAGNIARVTGSVAGAYSDGTHGAVIRRVASRAQVSRVTL